MVPDTDQALTAEQRQFIDELPDDCLSFAANTWEATRGEPMPPAMIEYMAETRRVRGRLRERAMPLDPSASGRPMSLYEWLEARGD